MGLHETTGDIIASGVYNLNLEGLIELSSLVVTIVLGLSESLLGGYATTLTVATLGAAIFPQMSPQIPNRLS